MQVHKAAMLTLILPTFHCAKHKLGPFLKFIRILRDHTSCPANTGEDMVPSDRKLEAKFLVW